MLINSKQKIEQILILNLKAAMKFVWSKKRLPSIGDTHLITNNLKGKMFYINH